MVYFRIYTDFAEDIAELTDEEKGRLFCMMLAYAKTGEPPTPQGAERYLWPTVRKMIDAQADAYDRICERNRANGIKHQPKATQENPVASSETQSNPCSQEKDKEKEKKRENTLTSVKEKRFQPPSLEEVKAYIQERHSKVDAERFVDYYQAQKWRLSNGVPMSDWRATLRNWERREQKPQRKPNRVISGYEQRPIGDIDSMIVDL